VTKRTNQFFINPSFIDVKPGWNPRFDFGDIEQHGRTDQASEKD